MSGGPKTTSSGLRELRLRIDGRFISATTNAAIAEHPCRHLADWLRAAINTAVCPPGRTPPAARLYDIRIWPIADSPRSWLGRVRVPAGLEEAILNESGRHGVFAAPKTRSGEICWLPRQAKDDDDLAVAIEHRRRHGGRLVSSARGLGLCVPAASLRAVSVAVFGADDVGLRGCPTFEAVIPAGLDPASLKDVLVVRDRLTKTPAGRGRRIWFRADQAPTAPWALQLPAGCKPATDADPAVDPSKPAAPPTAPAKPSTPPKPGVSYLEAARKRQRKAQKKPEEGADEGVDDEAVPGSRLADDVQPPRRKKTTKKADAAAASSGVELRSLRSENADLKARVDSLESVISMLTRSLAVALPDDPAIAAAAAALKTRPADSQTEEPAAEDTPVKAQLRAQLQEEQSAAASTPKAQKQASAAAAAAVTDVVMRSPVPVVPTVAGLAALSPASRAAERAIGEAAKKSEIGGRPRDYVRELASHPTDRKGSANPTAKPLKQGRGRGSQ